MRIALVHITQLPDTLRETWLGMVRHSFDKVLRSDTHVELRAIRQGLTGENVLDFDNPYFALLNATRVAEAIIEADREGFDAAVVHCFADPGVREARAAVRMPIFGAAEASLHFACQIGRRIAIVASNMPGQLAQIEEQVARHGLSGRLIPNGIRFDSEPFASAFPRWLSDPAACAESVARLARECARDGADVVVLGCAGTSLFCSMAGLRTISVGGGDVPIVDCIMAAMKTAEMAVDIAAGTGLPVTSRAHTPLPSPEDWSRVRSAFGLDE